jgi:hypothetical protein
MYYTAISADCQGCDSAGVILLSVSKTKEGALAPSLAEIN